MTLPELSNQDKQSILQEIEIKMDQQEACWNTGDIPCFMEHYWKSDSLRFIGNKGLTYGWQATLDNYLKSYPDKEAMGKLTFTNEVKEVIDIETAQVIGKWNLKRINDLGDLGGYYSLIWQKKNGKWVIISDHSS